MVDNTSVRSTEYLDNKVAAGALFLAGLVHLWIVPHHWEHAQAHGIFMAFAGLLEVGWGIFYFIRPTPRLRIAGILIAVGMITLWTLTRFLPVPYGHGPEEVDLAGIVSKLLEGTSAVILFAGLVRASSERRLSPRTWQSIFSVLFIALTIGLAVYEVARASEPLFPGLVSQEAADHEHGEDHEH